MPSRGRRTSAACLFCREKKLKCDAQRPRCSNCLAKGVDCQQGVVRQKPRPTNHRIAQLEQENASLREQCFQLRQESIAVSDGSSLMHSEGFLASASPGQGAVQVVPNRRLGRSSSDHHRSSPGRRSSHPEVPDSDSHRNRALLYHGPTSTVYHDNIASLGTGKDIEERCDSLVNDQWTRHLLFAQTARQRQLEPINLAAGKLDFDGVDPEFGMHLLSIYWSRQLYTAQIIYRPAFMRDMACGGPYFSRLLLNAVLFGVSKHCPRPEICSDPDDITTAGWRFRQRFTELLRESFDKSEITTIQALLIMSNSLFARCDERSLSWLYAGNAFNMIIDLGLHVLPPPNKVSAEELEARKRVLWGAYAVDKIQCLFQGRPPLLRQSNFKASLNFLDQYDELDSFQERTFTSAQHGPIIPSLNVSLLTKLCELSIITERILCELYSESQEVSLSQSRKISENVNSDLSKWRQSLPPQLDYFSHSSEFLLLPQSFCLVALSNVLIILSQRPLFTGSNDGAGNPAIVCESVSVCTAAANQIVQVLRDYSQHFSVSSSPYMLSYATYISATIHARIVAQKGKKSRSYQSLLLCRKVLQEHTRLYAAARKAKANLDRLIAQMGITTEDDREMDVHTGSVLGQSSLAHKTMPATDGSDGLDQTFGLGSTHINWDLSNLDLEAIAEGFRLDGELCYLMHPSGI